MAIGGIGLTTRRDQLTIMSDLLEIVHQPQRLTHILYKSNMSYGQLSKYLDDLTELGFLETKTKPFRAFIITEKGKQFHDMLSKKIPNSESESLL
jgi:predicted transcriptional regulator